METPPGDAVQIDYGYVGLRKLELEDRQSKVYLFIATLAAVAINMSRLFVHKTNRVLSHQTFVCYRTSAAFLAAL